MPLPIIHHKHWRAPVAVALWVPLTLLYHHPLTRCSHPTLCGGRIRPNEAKNRLKKRRKRKIRRKSVLKNANIDSQWMIIPSTHLKVQHTINKHTFRWNQTLLKDLKTTFRVFFKLNFKEGLKLCCQGQMKCLQKGWLTKLGENMTRTRKSCSIPCYTYHQIKSDLKDITS